MKINLSQEHLQDLSNRDISQLQALIDTGDDWLQQETLRYARMLLKLKLDPADKDSNSCNTKQDLV
jgi:hypothetical protein|tara:strand:+ start:600 stop:797 length:198 start_codon:yes stop_codon:yes gene_type:complete